MQRLRVLIPLGLAALTLTVPASGQQSKPSATPAAKAAPAPKAKPAKMQVGDLLDFDEAMPQVLPTAGSIKIAERRGRPMVLLFWGRNSRLSREALVELAAFTRKNELSKTMDVYAVGSFKEGKSKPADLKDAAMIEGVLDLPVLADEGLALSRLVGASQFPEIALFSKTGQLLIRGIRSVDHRRLGPQRSSAGDLMRLLAREGSFPVIKRAFPAYPGDRLIGRRFLDFELPRFDAGGWGKGLTERFSNLRSPDRPTVLFFFSSTCKHCQVDVPQLVKFAAENPHLYDIVGVTRIKNERHRKISASYFAQQGIKFPVLEDVGAVSELYRLNSTPTTFYISPGGRITKATYYQHANLEADYLKYYPALMGAPPPPPPAKQRGWHFPLKVKDPAGKVVDLSTLQGRPTLVHFWATWCVPCREELPGLLRRLPALEREANVLLISVDDEPEKVKAYQEKTGLKFKGYHSPSGGLADSVDFSRSVPRTYVLDAHGKLSKILSGSYDWDDPHRFTGVLGRLSQ